MLCEDDDFDESGAGLVAADEEVASMDAVGTTALVATGGVVVAGGGGVAATVEGDSVGPVAAGLSKTNV